jgi:2'-5' RNA ligase
MAAKQLSPHLSHKSALVLLPPSSIAAPIEAVRRIHDKQFHRWPAHINLLYPFLSSPSEFCEQHGGGGMDVALKEDIRERIIKATREIQPFPMSLNADTPGVFHHSPWSKTVWLGPITQAVQELQAALQAEFLDVKADRRPYKPHLSIGQAKSWDDIGKLSEAIRKSVSDFLSRNGQDDAPIALDWLVDRVCVIERNGSNDRFKTIETIELGKSIA